MKYINFIIIIAIILTIAILYTKQYRNINNIPETYRITSAKSKSNSKSSTQTV